MFQNFQIFSLPLGENVAASTNVDTAKAHAVLDRVGFKHRHELDAMMYKDCDEDGVEISGGEAQRLALARMLYRDTPLMILDEPTAALDPYAEYRFYEQFNEMVGDKTAIYITHRLSSCRFCDKVAVFEHGRLTQFGSHEELVKESDGKYYQLWNAQAKYFES